MSLECVVQFDQERTFGDLQDSPFLLCLLDAFLPEDVLFANGFHCVNFPVVLLLHE